jgi:hypothetical protein
MSVHDGKDSTFVKLKEKNEKKLKKTELSNQGIVHLFAILWSKGKDSICWICIFVKSSW